MPSSDNGNQRTSARTRRGRPRLAFWLVVAIPVSAMIAVALGSAASAAAFAASAHVSGGPQYLGDSAGTTFTFTVKNTGTTNNIGAVEIQRPSASWTVVACPAGPAGWVRATSPGACRYISATPTSDDIFPRATRQFQLKATSADGRNDHVGTWRVIISKNNGFGAANIAAASPTAAGALGATAHTWQVLSAPLSAGSPLGACPAGLQEAHAGSAMTVVVCARNHAYERLQPVASSSSLAGTMIATPGAFSSVSVPARSATLAAANWTGTTITSDPGAGKTVVVRLGSASNQTSPTVTLPGYDATNAVPVAAADAFSGPEDSVINGNVLGNDTDADGDPLTAAEATGPSHGVLSLAGDGSFAYTPAADFAGTDSFTYTVSDGFTDSVAVTVTLTVGAVNDAPVNTVPGAQTVLENGTLTFAAGSNGVSVADVDAAASDVTSTLTVTHGTLSAATLTGLTATSGDGTGTLVLTGPLSAVNAALDGLAYRPAADVNGPDTLTLVTSDGGATGSGGPLTDTDTVPITVEAVNSPPSFVKGADQAVLEDAGAQSVAGWATSISAGPADESGQAITFLVTSDNPALFSAGPAVAPDGTLTYTPAADQFGSATVSVTAQDDGGGTDSSAPQAFTIAVTPVNDAPTFSNAGNLPGVAEDAGPQTVSGWATGMSAGPANESGQALAFTVTTDNPGLFSAGPAVAPDGTLTYTAAPDATGTANITVTLTDDGGTANGGLDTSAPAVVSLVVGAVNDPPAFTKGADQSVLEDASTQTVPGWATGISAGPADESGQAVDFVVTTDNDALFALLPEVSPVGTLTYTPAADQFGSATVTVVAHDDGGGTDTSAPQTFTIAVTPVNDAPTFSPGADQTVAEDAGAQSVPAWATGISAGPANEASQTVEFVVGNDDNGLFAVQPAISADGTLTYTPAPDAFGSATVSVTMTDDGGTANGGDDTSSPQTFTITVSPVNDTPSFTKGGDETVSEDAGAQTVPSWATGISAGPANEASQAVDFVVGNDNNALFAVQPAVSPAGTLTYTPAADAFGTATVTVAIHDDGGGADTSAPQTFTITVTPVNDAPTFTKGADQDVVQDSGPQTVPSWATAISAGPANEAGQTVAFTVTNDDNALFSAQPAISPDGTLTYTSAEGATGDAIVSVTLTDDGGTAGGGDDTSATVTFTITVRPPNATPTAAPTSASGNEDGGAVTVTLSGHDEDGDALTFTAGTASNGLVTVPGPVDCTTTPNTCTTTVTYTPNQNFFGSDSFTYTVNDGTVESAPATASITINPVNDAPSFTAATGPTVNEDSGAYSGPIASAISAGPANESGQTVSFDVTSNSNPGLFSTGPAVAPDGTLTFTPAVNANGTATIALVLTDDGGTANGGVDSSAPQNVTITVTAVNDAPSFTKGADQTLNEDAGAQSISNWASAISKGPADESGQSLSFTSSNDNNALFSVQPGVTPTGTLVFTTAPNKYGTATVSVSLSDNGGTANGGDDTSDVQTFTITVNAVNDAPVAVAKSYTVQSNMKISLGGLLTGATDTADTSQNPAYTPTFSVGSITTGPGCVGCTVSNIDTANGTFDFDPPAGGTGTYTLSYTVVDTGDPAPGIASAPQTITLTVNGPVIWFVDTTAPAGGTGRLSAPFASLPPATTAMGSNVNQRIFVRGGNVAGNVTLPTDGWILSEAVTGPSFDSVMGITPPAGTIARPAVNGTQRALSGSVTVGSNSVVRGFDLTPPSGTPGLVGNGKSGLVVNQMSVTTTNARAVDLLNSSGVLTFSRISTTGAQRGISLVGTNVSTGSFTVTGTGTAGSGGTITGSTGAGSVASPEGGIYLNNTRNVSLDRMVVSNSTASGIYGRDVTGFTLANSTVSGNGTDVGLDHDGIRFDNLLGTATISGSTVNGSKENNVRVFNTSGTANLTVTNSTIRDNDASVGANGILVNTLGSAGMTFGATGNTFTSNNTSALAVYAQSTGTMSASIGTNTFTGNMVGVDLGHNGTGPATFVVDGVTVTGCASCGAPINVYKGTGATSNPMIATVRNSTVNNGNSGLAPGIWVHGEGAGSLRATVQNNTVRGVQHFGIYGGIGNGNASLDMNVSGNDVDVSNTGNGALYGIYIETGLLAGDVNATCANIKSNRAIGGAGLEGIAVANFFGGSFRLPGFAGGNDTAAESYIASGNVAPVTVDAQSTSGTGFVGGAACTTP